MLNIRGYVAPSEPQAVAAAATVPQVAEATGIQAAAAPAIQVAEDADPPSTAATDPQDAAVPRPRGYGRGIGRSRRRPSDGSSSS